MTSTSYLNILYHEPQRLTNTLKGKVQTDASVIVSEEVLHHRCRQLCSPLRVVLRGAEDEVTQSSGVDSGTENFIKPFMEEETTFC